MPKNNNRQGRIDEEFRKEWLTHSQYGFSICMNAGFKKIAKMIAITIRIVKIIPRASMDRTSYKYV